VLHLKGFGRGDLLIEVVVKTPENLTKRQQELLREFAEIDKSKKTNQKLFKFWNRGDKASTPRPISENSIRAQGFLQAGGRWPI